ncbi:hypothetical protein [Streptomyces acidiscabies]|uniref:Uncharacterized protein n=1 Tax=Streptomyces acidiscabies TaxID=42234 RepID=A0ABU4MCH1_9ACTN|nr:hypothetical protein [Streptomyces acidiscabies]MDX3024929.1 hypothetical protein [Streptomyces acidiscabies]
MTDDIAGVPSPDRTPQRNVTTGQVFAQLHLAFRREPGETVDVDEEGPARLRAWTKHGPADGSGTNCRPSSRQNCVHGVFRHGSALRTARWRRVFTAFPGR